MRQSERNGGLNGAGPTVSVVLPPLNERGFIRDCLDSLTAQDYPGLIEVLVCAAVFFLALTCGSVPLGSGWDSPGLARTG